MRRKLRCTQLAFLRAADVLLMHWHRNSAGRGRGRRPLPLALLTLFIAPVIYIYLDRIDRRLKRRLDPELLVAEEGEGPRVVAAE